MEAFPFSKFAYQKFHVERNIYMQKYTGLLFIILLFVFGAFLLLTNNMFNDDWAYSWIAKAFVENGELTFIGWEEPTMLGNILWGALFCLPFGFSHTALHLSTLVISILGAVSFYFILKHFKVGELLATIGTLLLIFNPIYFINSYTFMTDSSALGLCLLSLLLFLKYLKRNELYLLILSSVVAIFAFSIRQTAIILPLIFSLFLLYNTKNKRGIVLPISITALIPFLFMFGIMIWRYSMPNIYVRNLIDISPPLIAILFVKFLIYTGFFISPFSFAYAFKKSKGEKPSKKIILYSILSSIVVLYALFSPGQLRMPLLGNYLTNFGMFGLNEILAGERSMLFPAIVWDIVTVVSLSSLVIYFFLFSMKFFNLSKNRIYRNEQHIVYLFSLLSFTFPLIIGSGFDRYIIQWLPGVILSLAIWLQQSGYTKSILTVSSASIFFFMFVIIFDTAGWNNARWEMANNLVDSGVDPQHIDAGFEWCGWYSNKPVGFSTTKQNRDHYTSTYLTKYFDGIDNKYMIAFSELYGYEVLVKRKYNSIFWNNESYLFLLERK